MYTTISFDAGLSDTIKIRTLGSRVRNTCRLPLSHGPFFTDAAAAEVFVHGCCSSLNRTSHHLQSSNPPPLVTTSIYRAEIMSQTIQNGDIKTRSWV